MYGATELSQVSQASDKNEMIKKLRMSRLLDISVSGVIWVYGHMGINV